MVNLAQDSKPISSLAKLLSFGDKDIKNGKTISHENAKKIFKRTLAAKGSRSRK